jgi:hypothetical protein
MIQNVHPGSGSWFLPIRGPGSRGQIGTGSRIRIRNTAFSRQINRCLRGKKFGTEKLTFLRNGGRERDEPEI